MDFQCLCPQLWGSRGTGVESPRPGPRSPDEGDLGSAMRKGTRAFPWSGRGWIWTGAPAGGVVATRLCRASMQEGPTLPFTVSLSICFYGDAGSRLLSKSRLLMSRLLSS